MKMTCREKKSRRIHPLACKVAWLSAGCHASAKSVLIELSYLLAALAYLRHFLHHFSHLGCMACPEKPVTRHIWCTSAG